MLVNELVSSTKPAETEISETHTHTLRRLIMIMGFYEFVYLRLVFFFYFYHRFFRRRRRNREIIGQVHGDGRRRRQACWSGENAQ